MLPGLAVADGALGKKVKGRLRGDPWNVTKRVERRANPRTPSGPMNYTSAIGKNKRRNRRENEQRRNACQGSWCVCTRSRDQHLPRQECDYVPSMSKTLIAPAVRQVKNDLRSDVWTDSSISFSLWLSVDGSRSSNNFWISHSAVFLKRVYRQTESMIPDLICKSVSFVQLSKKLARQIDTFLWHIFHILSTFSRWTSGFNIFCPVTGQSNWTFANKKLFIMFVRFFRALISIISSFIL